MRSARPWADGRSAAAACSCRLPLLLPRCAGCLTLPPLPSPTALQLARHVELACGGAHRVDPASLAAVLQRLGYSAKLHESVRCVGRLTEATCLQASKHACMYLCMHQSAAEPTGATAAAAAAAAASAAAAAASPPYLPLPSLDPAVVLAALQACPLYKFKAGVRHQYISVCLPGGSTRCWAQCGFRCS